MARSVEVFRANGLEMRRLAAEREEGGGKGGRGAASGTAHCRQRFRITGPTGSSRESASVAVQVEAAAQTVAATSEQTRQQSTAVASASEEASRNVNMIAGATEELSSSIQEIGRQVALSSGITAAAVREADDANGMVEGLSNSVQSIGNVVQLISDIADPASDLLALERDDRGRPRRRSRRRGSRSWRARSRSSDAPRPPGRPRKSQSKVAVGPGLGASSPRPASREFGRRLRPDRTKSPPRFRLWRYEGTECRNRRDRDRTIQQAAIGTQEVSRNVSGMMTAAGMRERRRAELLNAARRGPSR